MLYNNDFCVWCCIDVYVGPALRVLFFFFVKNPAAAAAAFVLKLLTGFSTEQWRTWHLLHVFWSVSSVQPSFVICREQCEAAQASRRTIYAWVCEVIFVSAPSQVWTCLHAAGLRTGKWRYIDYRLQTLLDLDALSSYTIFGLPKFKKKVDRVFFKNRVLRRILGPKRGEVTAELGLRWSRGRVLAFST
jgi:hypothetical protein